MFKEFLSCLALLIISSAHAARRVGDRRILSAVAATDDCTTSLDNINSVVCLSFVPCSNELFYKKFNRIIFDLNTDSKFIIDKNTFFNCVISSSNRQIEIIFRDVQEIKQLAFHQFEMEANTRLTLKFDGGTGKETQFTLNKDTLKAFHLNPNSQLNIEIMNYKSVTIQDSLVQQSNGAILQDKGSSVYLSIHDCDYVTMTPSQIETNIIDDFKPDKQTPHDIFDHNKTYSLQIIHVDQFRLDSGIFSQLQIMPYSSVSIEIRSAYSCSLADNSFERLMIGTSGRFSLLVQNVNIASIGKYLFNRLQQSATSSFFFQMDQIGTTVKVNRLKKRGLEKNDKLNQYYEEDSVSYEDEQDYNSSETNDTDEYETSSEESTTTKSTIGLNTDDSFLYDDWFCVPEFLFKNLEQSESATAQMHFTRFQMSLSISSLAFSEFQLSENSKFQILIQDLRGHIFMDSKSIDLIRLSDGIFELWIENHRQLVLDKGNRQKKQPNKFNAKDSVAKSASQSPLRLMQKTRNTYLKLNDLAFNKIFLSTRSLFRIGYINSDSLFIINPKALNGFHNDEMTTNNGEDYRTKVSFEIKQSANIRFDFVSQQELVSNEEDLSYFPKLIEIDGYEPIMSSTQDTKSFTQSEILIRQQEFCRYFKLRPLIAPLKYKLPNAVFNANNFVYFSEPIKMFAKQANMPQGNQCTSCLFIYLYRTIHRRHDFYFIKDHLPQCFINLHFGTNLYLIYKRESIKTIEQSFIKYWAQLNCEKITGLSYLFQYDVYANSNQNSDATELQIDPKQTDLMGDETFTDFERISKHCRKMQDSTGSIFSRHDDEIKSVLRLNQDKWHDSSARICSKNVLDSTLNSSRLSVRISLKKFSNQPSQRGGFSWSLFFAMFLLCSSVTIMIALTFLQYKKSRSNLGSNVSSCMFHVRSSLQSHGLNNNKFEQLKNDDNSDNQRFKKTTVVSYNKLVKNDHKLTNENDDDEDDDENREEIHFDELNNYEYDDDFGLSAANDSIQNNENIQFKETTAFAADMTSSTDLSIDNLAVKFKQLKNNLFNKNVLKSSLLPVSTSTAPIYSYNSTDSTLVQQTSYEFKDLDATSNYNCDVQVVYDINKMKSKQNIVKKDLSSLSEEEYNKTLRLSTNPLETYLEKIEMDNLKKQAINE